MAPFACHHRVRAVTLLALAMGIHPTCWSSMAQQTTSSSTSSTTCTSICGEGNSIMYPDAVIQFQDVFGQNRQFGCYQAQKMVESGMAPEGFCSDIVPHAIVPCGCVQPDGMPASAPVSSPRPVVTAPAPSPPAPVAAPSVGNGQATTTCPRRRQVLDTCLANIDNGDDCMSCVTSYYPLFATTCTSIDQETCTGLAQCPCETCLNRFLRYIKCLAPQCASQLCHINTTVTTMPAPATASHRSSIPTRMPGRPSQEASSSSSSAPSFSTASERTIFSGATGAQRTSIDPAVALMTAIIAVVLT